MVQLAPDTLCAATLEVIPLRHTGSEICYHSVLVPRLYLPRQRARTYCDSRGGRTHTITMPAPTALKAPLPEAASANALPTTTPDENLLDDPSTDLTVTAEPTQTEAMQLDDVVDEEGRPRFAPAVNTQSAVRVENRKIPIPPHRFTPLKAAWPKMYPPLVDHLKLMCRMNIKTKSVELKTSRATSDTGAIQKGADFVRAFALGFDVDDAIALLRLDDLYIESELSLYIMCCFLILTSHCSF